MPIFRWRRSHRRGVAPIIATILLLGMTIAVFSILFSFKFATPPTPPTTGYAIRSGGSTPVWGDPTDCQPLGTWSYPLPAGQQTAWGNDWWNQCEYFSESLPGYTTPGNFSLLNTTQLTFSSLSSGDIPLTDINVTFVCNGAYAPSPYTTSTNTILMQGTLDELTWNPGISTTVPANAPYLGYCGGFDMGAEAGVAFGAYFDRLLIFVPIVPFPGGNTASLLAAGDTIYVYIHNGGWPLDYACVVASQPWAGDPAICPDGTVDHALLDVDDYHGTPPWCFNAPGACTLYITYTGYPSSLIAAIPVSSLAANPA
ncbi:MAG: archaellin/type IV pilin N-terminal domain-containing protein [Thermoplasmata archaeon]